MKILRKARLTWTKEPFEQIRRSLLLLAASLTVGRAGIGEDAERKVLAPEHEQKPYPRTTDEQRKQSECWNEQGEAAGVG